MIETRIVPAHEYNDVKISDLWLFTSKENSMIICPVTGTTLGVKNDIVDKIMTHSLSEDALFLLVQRGMATCVGSRPVSCEQDDVNPSFFLIDLTKTCNLQCAYCFRELDHNSKKMSEEKIDEICDALIGYCKENPCRGISVQAWGGEPLLELPKIIQMRRRFDSEKLTVKIVIETNATLISENVAKLLFENKIDVGVSIDGPAFIHDKQRRFQNNQPSLNKVENGIANLRKAGYSKFGSITVVTRNTYKHLEETICYFAETLKLPTIKLNLMRQTDNNHDMALSLNEIDSYVQKLIDSMRYCMQTGKQIIELNLSQRIANLLYRPCDNICNAHGCHGGYRMISIDSQGDIFPCELTDDSNYAIGNIREFSIKKAVESAIENNHIYFQHRHTDECVICPWYFYCRGGCKAASKYYCKDPRTIDYTECAFNKALYPRLVEILLEEPELSTYLLSGVKR